MGWVKMVHQKVKRREREEKGTEEREGERNMLNANIQLDPVYLSLLENIVGRQ